MTKFGFLIKEKGNKPLPLPTSLSFLLSSSFILIGIIVFADDWSVEDVAVSTQNTLICIEMFPIALAYSKSFGYKSFKEPSSTITESIELYSSSSSSPTMLKSSQLQDIKSESSGRRSLSVMVPKVLSNFADVANVKDVVDDTIVSLKKV